MWNSCAKFDRLKKALKHRGLNPESLNLNELARVFKKRGITDKKQNDIVCSVLSILEPPNCWMSHCKHFGGQSFFCYCTKEKIPGKCNIYRDYKKRQKEKAIKAADNLLGLISEDFTEDVLLLIDINWNYWQFYDGLLKKDEKFLFVKKWSHPLQINTWAEIQRRAKEAIVNAKAKP